MSFNWTGGTLTMGGGGAQGAGERDCGASGLGAQTGQVPPPQHTIRPRAAGWLVTA